MKYDALREHLQNQQAQEVSMTFGEIEKVIDAPLPAKASQHRAWWSNNPSNNVMTKAWLEAGFQSERVDMASRRLVFRKVGRPALPRPGGGGSGVNSTPDRIPLSGADRFKRLYGVLRGTTVIGGDITEPTGEAWAAEG